MDTDSTPPRRDGSDPLRAYPIEPPIIESIPVTNAGYSDYQITLSANCSCVSTGSGRRQTIVEVSVEFEVCLHQLDVRATIYMYGLHAQKSLGLATA